MTQISNQEFANPSNDSEQNMASSDSVSDNTQTVTPIKKKSFWQKLTTPWNNLPFKLKITILLLTGAAIPVFAVTQGIVSNARDNAFANLQQTLELDLLLLEDAIDTQKKELEATANTIGLSVQASNIDLQNITSSSSPESQKLKTIIDGAKAQKSNVSFYIITDSQGKTVAQYVQTVNENTGYPQLPEDTSQFNAQFKPVPNNANFSLKNVAIVKNTLQLSRPLSGIELINSQVLQQLGLAEQADIGLRQQKIEGLAEEKKPYPEETFKIEQGTTGLVLMATQPIKLGNNQVGTAVVGTLINRNFELVDRLKEVTKVPTATIFAQDWRVSTNVPYSDKETRAIGTRVSREVANTVLNNKEVYLGNANIIGIEYLTGYAPIYDHNKQLDPEKAIPVGIAYVGAPNTKVEEDLGKISLTGYSIGGGVLLVFAIVLFITPSDAGISKQLKRLTEFAGQVASAESGVRLEDDDRKDEIGVLTRNLNEMAKNVDTNLETRQKEAQIQKEERERLEQDIYNLLEEIQDAADGDLTVRASLDSMEMSTVADLFNAVIDSLQDIAIQVKDSSKQVTESLGENESSIQMLAQQAVEEAKQSQTTLVEVEKMSDSINQVATNANQASSLADEAYQETEASSDAMDQTVNSIVSLRNTVGETAKKMKRLGESSQKISQVVSLIEEIALKTNLLAINASVEASRAGEQGQGFTVVAEQVGALAEQSSVATKEIAKIVAAIQNETQEVSKAMELGTTQVIDSTRLVESTKDRLNQVLERSRSINELMKQISESTVSQTDTSQLVTELMQQITQQTEQRLKDSQTIAESIKVTAQVAEELESAVEQFEVEKETI